MKERCHHVGLACRDLRSLADFYTKKLGFEEGETREVSGDWMERIFGVPAACRMIKLRLGRAVVELFSSPNLEWPERGPEVRGYNHWGLAVEDKAAFIRSVESRGVPVLKLKAGERLIAFVRDPEGNLIEVYQDQA